MPLDAVGWHFAAGGVGLAVGFTLFAFGFIGGGDAKLFACAALALGWNDLFEYALIASLFAGHGMASAPRARTRMIGFAAVVSLALLVIVNYEFPRLGFIRIDVGDSVISNLRRTMN